MAESIIGGSDLNSVGHETFVDDALLGAASSCRIEESHWFNSFRWINVALCVASMSSSFLTQPVTALLAALNATSPETPHTANTAIVFNMSTSPFWV